MYTYNIGISNKIFKYKFIIHNSQFRVFIVNKKLIIRVTKNLYEI